MQVETTAGAVVVEEQDSVTRTPQAPQLDKALIAALVDDAQASGLGINGENGLLAQLTKLVLESALEGEITAHLGYDKHEKGASRDGNARNGTRAKTVLTKGGPVQIEVPRDRAGTFEPAVVRKRQRRLGSIEDIVLSLSARGMTHGDISAHLADVYGSEVSKTTISTITDKVLDGMAEWQSRPLDPVYPVVFIDCIHVKVRDGQVANRPIYVALAVTVDGNRDILGLWAGDGGEGAKYWLQVLTEIKNRGVEDILMVVCDGLKGLPDSVNTVWTDTIVQTCIVHLMRNSFRYASRAHWDAISRALKPVYQAATLAEAEARFEDFVEAWQDTYPAIVRLWRNAWAEFVPFLAFDREIRRIICTTNAIESVNARIRKAVRARGHFPNEQAALKCIYLAVMALDPTGTGRARWTMRWKQALNAFDITFDGRLSAHRR
ncbi:transposase-like protein [Isoptericola jiangsuensis]|uniref:Mutator family transposase n=1 Tax=Isoptericola jiangsuensis TaxID=548579 RepID=A0A2A9F056_9MICO|nr:transposase-like protein [Isoptericola jiangsuensis]